MRHTTITLEVKQSLATGAPQPVSQFEAMCVQIGPEAGFTGTIRIRGSANGGVDYVDIHESTGPEVVQLPGLWTHLKIQTVALSVGTPTATLLAAESRTQ